MTYGVGLSISLSNFWPTRLTKIARKYWKSRQNTPLSVARSALLSIRNTVSLTNTCIAASADTNPMMIESELWTFSTSEPNGFRGTITLVTRGQPLPRSKSPWQNGHRQLSDDVGRIREMLSSTSLHLCFFWLTSSRFYKRESLTRFLLLNIPIILYFRGRWNFEKVSKKHVKFLCKILA